MKIDDHDIFQEELGGTIVPRISKTEDYDVSQEELDSTIAPKIPKTEEKSASTRKKTTKKSYKAKVIDCAKLNIRFEPNTSSISLGTVAKDSVVDVDEDFGEWVHASFGNLGGFMMKKYLAKV